MRLYDSFVLTVDWPLSAEKIEHYFNGFWIRTFIRRWSFVWTVCNHHTLSYCLRINFNVCGFYFLNLKTTTKIYSLYQFVFSFVEIKGQYSHLVCIRSVMWCKWQSWVYSLCAFNGKIRFDKNVFRDAFTNYKSQTSNKVIGIYKLTAKTSAYWTR